MSSLLEGIDVGEGGAKKSKSSNGINPKVVKGIIAVVLLIAAGVLLGIQFGVIPSPFGGSTVKNSAGEEVIYQPLPESEVKETMERLERERQEFIRRGGIEGGA
ncbi:MAG: hypothetical protein KatS3mg103_0541 [Phycisphaerales bacterium]|nr:MAG: hypothetical protein KatS3mg103_0541 [Phycisphaerales bacterium]